jgi:hypothetical protein
LQRYDYWSGVTGPSMPWTPPEGPLGLQKFPAIQATEGLPCNRNTAGSHNLVSSSSRLFFWYTPDSRRQTPETKLLEVEDVEVERWRWIRTRIPRRLEPVTRFGGTRLSLCLSLSWTMDVSWESLTISHTLISNLLQPTESFSKGHVPSQQV